MKWKVMFMKISWNYNDLTNIDYKFVEVKKGRTKFQECQNVVTFDIETSNGFRATKPEILTLEDGSSLSLNEGDTIGYEYVIQKLNPAFFENAGKVSLMYVWQSAIETKNDIWVFLGRTWDDFLDYTKKLAECVTLAGNGYKPKQNQFINRCRKTPIWHMYIHNLGFEFQHLRNVFDDAFSDHDAVFARSARKPFRVTMDYEHTKLILNDTLCLSQKSLKNWGKDSKWPVQKLEEPRNYYLPVRTPTTPLTAEEIKYSVNDVVSMIFGVKEYRDKYGCLNLIPMTQTGEVRKKCIEEIAMVDTQWEQQCRTTIDAMDFETYCELYKAFAGGWTHGNSRFVGMNLENVQMYDFRSSYPAVMVSRTYPVTPWETITKSEMELIQKRDINDRDYHYYVIFSCENVESKLNNTFWSSSKCDEIKGEQLDNGRIYSCDYLKATMTDLDFERFCEVYDYDNLTIHKVRKSKAGHLSKAMIEVILGYYVYKTSLKGDATQESKYNESKQFINSIYGVCVTKVITDIISYMYTWEKRNATVEDYQKAIEQLLNKPCFCTYQMGVWVTAWARHNLWDAISHLDAKTVYCDTDSIKGLFDDNDRQWFDDYNKGIWKLCEKVSQKYGIDIELFRPKTKPKFDDNGVMTKPAVTKEIGYFDNEGVAEYFKTLGAKRYLMKVDGEWIATIAGLAKDRGVEKLQSLDDFHDDIEWTAEESGKLISHYNDEQPTAHWIDRDGNTFDAMDKFGICLEPTSFSMGMAEDFKEFLSWCQGNELDDYFDTPQIMRELI